MLRSQDKQHEAQAGDALGQGYGKHSSHSGKVGRAKKERSGIKAPNPGLEPGSQPPQGYMISNYTNRARTHTFRNKKLFKKLYMKGPMERLKRSITSTG